MRVVDRRIARRAADDPDATRGEVVARLLLRGVEIAGRDELGAATLQRDEERDGLGLEVDPCADDEPREGPRLVELRADREQKAAVLDHPLDAIHADKTRGPEGPP